MESDRENLRQIRRLGPSATWKTAALNILNISISMVVGLILTILVVTRLLYQLLFGENSMAVSALQYLIDILNETCFSIPKGFLAIFMEIWSWITSVHFNRQFSITRREVSYKPSRQR